MKNYDGTWSNLLKKNQNGFRQHQSTIDNLTTLDLNICMTLLINHI